MPKVSVIVPIYGVENYIEKCARSLFEQTLEDIEFIFIDDCSPDNSINVLNQVLEEYIHRKPQVTIYRMEQNSGQAEVRKWGILNASGEYIIHCDSDDWIERDMISNMYENAVENNSDIVVCGYCYSDGNNILYTPNIDFRDKDDLIRKILTWKRSWAVWNKLVKRQLFDNSFRFPQCTMAEDFVITMQCILNSTVISYLNCPYYNYRQNPNSITHSKSTEILLKNFNDVVCNTNIVLDIMNNKRLTYLYLDEIEAFKFYNKFILSQTAQNDQIYKKWKESYPEIDYRVFLNTKIRLYEKCLYILKLFRLR